MKIRILTTSDIEKIVRQQFGKNMPINLHAYLLTFNMICRKYHLAVVQTEPNDYNEFADTIEIEVE